VVYGGFQDPKFRRQSMKTRARERKEKGREERKSSEMLKLVNFDQKIDSNNTGSFNED
jgi:hypothetical protein